MKGFSKRQGAAQSKLVHELIQQRGVREGEYALFFVTSEGEFLPAGPLGDRVEEVSGYVLDKHGSVFFFWLGWNPVEQEVALTEWREVQPEPHWAPNVEYRRARQRLGLPAG